MTGPWKRWKTQQQVSHRSHSPLEIANTAIPTFPQRRRRVLFFRTPKRLYARALRALAAHSTTQERSDPWHPNQCRTCVRFQAHTALESNPTFRLIERWNQISISGSFLDWKMLRKPIDLIAGEKSAVADWLSRVIQLVELLVLTRLHTRNPVAIPAIPVNRRLQPIFKRHLR